ncbi:MAG: O-antigen ligase family protein [Armatimonadetes bacterium]|nr:O-antigen ligase family protein [Armatimonadota bacterium]
MRELLGQRSFPSVLWALVVCLLAAILGGLVATNLPLAIAVLVAAVALAVMLLRPRLALGFLLMTGCLPLNFITGGERSVLGALGGSTVSGLLLIVYVPSLLILLLTRHQLASGLRLYAIPASWVVWSTLTLTYSDWLDEGVRLAFKLWYPLLVGVLAYHICRQPSGLRFVRRWWYLGYAVTSLVAVVRTAVVGLAISGSGRYTALMHPSPFSFFMLVTFVLTCALYIRERRRVDGIVAITAAAQIFLSLTRISMAALVVALLLMSILVGHGFRQRLRGSLAALAIGAALLLAFVALPALQQGVFFRPVSSVGQVLSDPANLNTQGRDVVWAAIVTEYGTGDLLLGRGLGSTTRLFAEGEVSSGTGEGSAGVVHSEYVRVLYEGGLVGLSWFGAALLGSLVYLGIRLRRTEGTTRALLGAAFVAVFVYAIICITDNALDYYNVVGQYVAVVAGAGLALRSKQLAARSEELL